MNFLTKSEFTELKRQDAYWAGRWEYLSKVVEILKSEHFGSCLELGPYKQTVVKGADVMDLRDMAGGTRYVWNATDIPWPVADRQYDMFVALQVWEHLYGKHPAWDSSIRPEKLGRIPLNECSGPKQKEAFSEARRISKAAVLSFPYNWNCPGDVHHGISRDRISEWTLGLKPKRVEVVESRIIYLFVF